MHRSTWRRILLETIVIVGSILLALAIEAAWEERANREAEGLYYELLDRDLGQTIEELEYYLGFEEERAAAARRAYDALSGGPALSPEELSISVSVATQRRTLRLHRPTFTDLTSTGSLQLLRDRELRDRIIGFYEAAERDFAVIERNTIFYLDRLGLDAVYGPGLIRGSYPGFVTTFDSRGYREPDDRLWSMDRESEEVAAVRSVMWLRSFGFTPEAERVLESARVLRAEIRSELEAW